MSRPVYTIWSVLLVLGFSSCATTLAPTRGLSISAALSEVSFYPDTSQVQALQAQRLFVRALTLHLNDETEKALSLMNDALTLQPNQPVLLAALGEMYQTRGDLPTARFYTRQACTRMPERPSCWIQLAKLEAATGALNAAATAYQRALDLAPSDLTVRRELAETYAALDDHPAAIRHFEVLLQHAPRDRDLALTLIALYQQTGQTGEAHELEQAFDLVPSDEAPAAEAASPVERGLAEYEAENFAEAASLLAQGLRENPRYPEAWAVACQAYLKIDQPSEGLSVVEEGALLFPGQADLLACLTRAALRLDQNQTALLYFDELESLLQNDPTIEFSADLDALRDLIQTEQN